MSGSLKPQGTGFNKDLFEIGTCGLVILVVAIAAVWILSTEMFIGAFP